MFDVPGCPVISEYGTPTEKVPEFLDYNPQSVIKSVKSYGKDIQDVLEKLRYLGKVPSNTVLVTADVVGLYPSFPHEVGLKALYKKLKEKAKRKSHLQI